MRHGRRLSFALALAVVGGALLSACGSSTDPDPVATTFRGTIAGGGNQSGTLTVTVQSQVASARPAFPLPFEVPLHAESVSASGTMRIIGGATTTLTGTYDTTSRALSLSGSPFTFTGATTSGGGLTGTYTGSGVSGTFAAWNPDSATVTVYCGNIFSSGNPNEVTGVFNLVVAGNAVTGVFSIIGSGGLITGTRNGSALSLTYVNTTQSFTGTATGSISGNAVSGTSNSNNPFSGTTTACPS